MAPSSEAQWQLHKLWFNQMEEIEALYEIMYGWALIYLHNWPPTTPIRIHYVLTLDTGPPLTPKPELRESERRTQKEGSRSCACARINSFRLRRVCANWSVMEKLASVPLGVNVIPLFSSSNAINEVLPLSIESQSGRMCRAAERSVR